MRRTFQKNPEGLVLLYHRVVRLETDPQLLAVTPEHFAEHLDVLNRVAFPVGLHQLWTAANAGDIMPGSVALSFDDGYADNLHQAEPLLRQRGLPATVFATTGHSDTVNEFFWDELDRLLLQPNRLPSELMLRCGQNIRRFDLQGCVDYSMDQWKLHRGWNVLEPASPGSRQQLYLDLCSQLHLVTTDQRHDCLKQLQDWAGFGCMGRESHRMMTSAELFAIGSSGLIDIGAHTVTHARLADETVDRQIAEINGSKNKLEAVLGRPVKLFSYPFGTRRDYTVATHEAVRAAGFELACANYVGKVHPTTDCYQIPRLIVRDWDGAEFERRLLEWFAMPFPSIQKRAVEIG